VCLAGSVSLHNPVYSGRCGQTHHPYRLAWWDGLRGGVVLLACTHTQPLFMCVLLSGLHATHGRPAAFCSCCCLSRHTAVTHTQWMHVRRGVQGTGLGLGGRCCVQNRAVAGACGVWGPLIAQQPEIEVQGVSLPACTMCALRVCTPIKGASLLLLLLLLQHCTAGLGCCSMHQSVEQHCALAADSMKVWAGACVARVGCCTLVKAVCCSRRGDRLCTECVGCPDSLQW
jgi:hypothetical protein